MPLQAHVPAFLTLWGFTLASDSPLAVLSEEEINRRLAARIGKELRFYDGETQRHMSSLPKYLRTGIQQESRINRDASPVFMI